MFKHLLLLVLTTLPAWAALAGGVFIATDTSATNARPSAVTITPLVGGTNLNAGVVNATNDIRLNGVSILGNLTIWTNDNGAVHLVSPAIPGLSANLGVTDNSVFMGTNGSIYLGRDSINQQGGSIQNTDVLVSYRTQTNSLSSKFTITHHDTAAATASDLYFEFNPGQAIFNLEAFASDFGVSSREAHTVTTGADPQSIVAYYRQGSSDYLQLGNNVEYGPYLYAVDELLNKYFLLSPYDSGEAPYQFGTKYSASSGNLVEVKNSTTNKAWITFDGQVHGSAFVVGGVPITSSAGANPSASLGLSAVNGVATTFLRSDGAPALSQAIAPTWTGIHVFNPAAGVPITIQPSANTTALIGQGYSVTGSGTTVGYQLTGTFNTSGVVPGALQIKITNTASAATSRLLNILGGAAGATDLAYVDVNGSLVLANSVSVASTGSLIVGVRGRVNAAADGVFKVVDNATTGGTSFQVGPDDATPNSAMFKGPSGVGTDIAGGAVLLAGGASTGAGAPGQVQLQTTSVGSTGSSANALFVRLYANHTNVVVTNAVLQVEQGINSTASDAAIAFTPTGITNTFGKLAQALFDGVAMTYIVRNGAGTPIYTNTALIPVGFAVLQANGSISITAGSGVVGTLSPL